MLGGTKPTDRQNTGNILPIPTDRQHHHHHPTNISVVLCHILLYIMYIVSVLSLHPPGANEE